MEGQLVIFLGNQLLCFVNFKIANQWIIMVATNYLNSDNLWHVK